MTIKSLATSLAAFFSFVVNCHANWTTTPVRPGTLINPIYQGQHDSHATSNGHLNLAFVVRNNEQDFLYFTTRTVIVPDPIQFDAPLALIDVGDRIRSIQIRHNESTGKTHFAYSKQNISKNGNLIHTNERLVHALFDPADPSQITKTTITSRSPLAVQPYEVSLALPHVLNDEANKKPAMAYHVPGKGQLFYAEESDPATGWTISGIQSLPDLGSGCDLHFDLNGNPAVVYQRPSVRTLHFARRIGNNPWKTRVFAAAAEGLSILEPSVRMDAFTPTFSYVVRGDSNQTLRYGTLAGFNAPLSSIVVDQVTTPGGRDPFIPLIQQPKLAITPNHEVYLSYSKSTEASDQILAPWIARKEPASAGFSKIKLPLPQNDIGVPNGQTSLSLDGENHPIVCWISYNAAGDGFPRASYNADIVDLDGDGFNFLEELAYKMDPNQSDAHKGPQLKIIPDPTRESKGRFVELLFPTSDEDSTDFDQRGVFNDDFRYLPCVSQDLKNWTLLTDVEMKIISGKVSLKIRNPLNEESPTRQLFRVDISRR